MDFGFRIVWGPKLVNKHSMLELNSFPTTCHLFYVWNIMMLAYSIKGSCSHEKPESKWTQETLKENETGLESRGICGMKKAARTKGSYVSFKWVCY